MKIKHPLMMALSESRSGGDAGALADAAIGKAKARGRKDSTGAAAVIKIKPLKDSFKELAALNTRAEAARDKFNDAVVAVAESAGMKSTVVKKLIKAAAKDKIEEVRAEIEQMDIAFNDEGLSKLVKGAADA